MIMRLLLQRNKSPLTFIRAVELGEKLAIAHRCLTDAERVGVRQLDGNRFFPMEPIFIVEFRPPSKLHVQLH